MNGIQCRVQVFIFLFLKLSLNFFRKHYNQFKLIRFGGMSFNTGYWQNKKFKWQTKNEKKESEKRNLEKVLNFFADSESFWSVSETLNIIKMYGEHKNLSEKLPWCVYKNKKFYLGKTVVACMWEWDFSEFQTRTKFHHYSILFTIYKWCNDNI